MHRSDICLLGLAAAIAVAGCSPANDVRSQIGTDGELLPTAVHADEVITLIQWKRTNQDADQISIEILPDGRIAAKHYEAEFRADGSIKLITTVLDSVAIDPKRLRKIRSRLEPYRPASLDGEHHYLFPKGCSMVIDGGPALANVSFDDRNGRRGGFILQRDCQNESARIISNDLQEIIQMLPTLKGASGYGWIR